MARYGSSDTTMSQAARAALNELAESHKTEILDRASKHAQAEDRSEISAHDIFRAFQGLEDRGPRRDEAGRDRLRRVLSLYVALGVAISLLGTLVVLFLAVANVDRPGQLVAVIAGVSGALLASLSAVILLAGRRSRAGSTFTGAVAVEPAEDFRKDLSLRFLDEWIRLEALARSKVTAEDDAEASTRPLPRIVDELHRQGAIDEKDLGDLRKALDTRNALVHHARPVAPEELANSLHRVRRLRARLNGDARLTNAEGPGPKG